VLHITLRSQSPHPEGDVTSAQAKLEFRAAGDKADL